PVSPQQLLLGFTQPTVSDYCFGHPTSNMVNCVTIDKGDRLTVGFRALGFTQPTVLLVVAIYN
ncbi:hypothetical protein, partial [Limnospira fusiformis]|uniref:hypothetical protein n=1 Tax=Limnospira fusiformis TaxID=54297 RepID=UPI002AA18E3C|nr:hypothetical protein [Limnospira fusiformis LS22]